MKYITLAETPDGDRVELTITLPSEHAAALAVGQADQRIKALIQQEVERVRDILHVAKIDYAAAQAAPAPDAGPHQVAFAGSTQPAIPLDQIAKK